MTITKAFAQWMQDNDFATQGQDLFIGGVPADLVDKAPDTCWWIYANGGTPITKNTTGEKQKNYLINVYFRDLNARNVDEQMQAFEILVNGKNCDQLTGFDTIEMEATGFQTDIDLDNEERTVGFVQVTIRVYSNN